jgi:hypothetical protein
METKRAGVKFYFKGVIELRKRGEISLSALISEYNQHYDKALWIASCEFKNTKPERKIRNLKLLTFLYANKELSNYCELAAWWDFIHEFSSFIELSGSLT